MVNPKWVCLFAIEAYNNNNIHVILAAGLGKKHVFFKKNKKRVFFVLKRILLF